MRPDNQVLLRRMHQQVVDRSSRQVAAQRLPGSTAIQARVDAHVGADVDQVWNRWIFVDDVDRFARQTVADSLPGLAEIVRPEHVCRIIIDTRAGQRGEDSVLVVRRWEHASEGSLRQAFVDRLP